MVVPFVVDERELLKERGERERMREKGLQQKRHEISFDRHCRRRYWI